MFWISSKFSFAFHLNLVGTTCKNSNRIQLNPRAFAHVIGPTWGKVPKVNLRLWGFESCLCIFNLWDTGVQTAVRCGVFAADIHCSQAQITPGTLPEFGRNPRNLTTRFPLSRLVMHKVLTHPTVFCQGCALKRQNLLCCWASQWQPFEDVWAKRCTDLRSWFSWNKFFVNLKFDVFFFKKKKSWS